MSFTMSLHIGFISIMGQIFMGYWMPCFHSIGIGNGS